MLTFPKSFSSLVVILVLTASVSATITWTTIDYPGAVRTEVNGVNNNGDVVGSYQDAINFNFHGFLLSGGLFTTIDFPGADWTNAEGINDSGDIVGTYSISANPFFPIGFIFHNGVMRSFRIPGREDTWVHGINNNGDIVGESQLYTGTIGFVWKRGSGLTRIVAPGAASTSVRGINNSGDIVGFYLDNVGLGGQAHGFVLHDGIWQLLHLSRSEETWAHSINDNHQVAGTALQVGSFYKGFAIYHNDILILGRTPSDFVSIVGINNNAEMVGWFYDTTNSTYHGFVRTR
jgi:uncharacterized membrane protein